MLIISLPEAAAAPALELALLPARGDAGALAAAAATAAETAGWWAGEAGGGGSAEAVDAAPDVVALFAPPRLKTLTTLWVCSQICRKRRT